MFLFVSCETFLSVPNANFEYMVLNWTALKHLVGFVCVCLGGVLGFWWVFCFVLFGLNSL